MSFLSSFFPIPGIGGNVGGGVEPITAGPAENNSINITGSSGGSLRDLMQLIHVSGGSQYNGGFTGLFTAEGRYSSYGTSTTQTSGSSNIKWLVIGGAILGAALLLKK